MHSLEEKKELVIENYRMSYDLDIAMLKVGLTDDEKKLLLNDTSFMYRINYQDALIREDIMATMLSNMHNRGPISQKAALDLANVLWADKFKNKESGPPSIIPDKIILKGE